MSPVIKQHDYFEQAKKKKITGHTSRMWHGLVLWCELCVTIPPSEVLLPNMLVVHATEYGDLPGLAWVRIAPSDLGLRAACLGAVTVIHQGCGLVNNPCARYDGPAFSWKSDHGS